VRKFRPPKGLQAPKHGPGFTKCRDLVLSQVTLALPATGSSALWLYAKTPSSRPTFLLPGTFRSRIIGTPWRYTDKRRACYLNDKSPKNPVNQSLAGVTG
jgi:hypothetical protein